jgi:hypothetical protein
MVGSSVAFDGNGAALTGALVAGASAGELWAGGVAGVDGA